MKRNRKIYSLLLLSGLVFMPPTGGAVSFDSSYSVSRYYYYGTSYRVLPTHANHFCYLSRVGIEETDTGGEVAQCQVRRSGTVWLLEASLLSNGDHSARCSAYCYNN